MAKAEDEYDSARDIAFAGQHLFKVVPEPIGSRRYEGPVRVYLRSGSYVECAGIGMAAMQFARDMVDHDIKGGTPRDLPTGHGFVTTSTGEVVGFFRPDGSMCSLRYLGRPGESVATRPFRMPDRLPT